MTNPEPAQDSPQEPGTPGVVRNRVQFPLIQNGHLASPEEEMTPDRVARILIEDEVRWATQPSIPDDLPGGVPVDLSSVPWEEA